MNQFHLEVSLICPRQHDYANNLCSAHTYVRFSSPCVTHHGRVRKMHCRGDSTHTGLIISIRCKYESNRDTILEGFFTRCISAFTLMYQPNSSRNGLYHANSNRCKKSSTAYCPVSACCDCAL